MEINFKDKVVVVTGAAGGLGLAISEAFAVCGARVAACDLKNTAEKIKEIKEKGFTIYGYDFDITDSDSVAEKMEEIRRELGDIDILINNAGINVGPDQRKTIENFDDKWWHAIQDVDLGGVYNCSKAAINNMGENGGVIINISSIVGMVPLRNQCSFAAAKAGVINLSKAMAIELAEKNIRVNVICPGTIGIEVTNLLWQNDDAMKGLLAHIPQGRQGKPSDIANATLFLASDMAAYITGAVLPVDGGWTAGGFARNF